MEDLLLLINTGNNLQSKNEISEKIISLLGKLRGSPEENTKEETIVELRKLCDSLSHRLSIGNELGDYAYHILLFLAKTFPFNEEDPFNLDDRSAYSEAQLVFLSTGHWCNKTSLICYANRGQNVEYLRSPHYNNVLPWRDREAIKKLLRDNTDPTEQAIIREFFLELERCHARILRGISLQDLFELHINTLGEKSKALENFLTQLERINTFMLFLLPHIQESTKAVFFCFWRDIFLSDNSVLQRDLTQLMTENANNIRILIEMGIITGEQIEVSYNILRDKSPEMRCLSIELLIMLSKNLQLTKLLLSANTFPSAITFDHLVHCMISVSNNTHTEGRGFINFFFTAMQDSIELSGIIRQYRETSISNSKLVLLYQLYKISPRIDEAMGDFLSWVLSKGIENCREIVMQYTVLIRNLGWKIFRKLDDNLVLDSSEFLQRQAQLVPEYCQDIYTFIKESPEIRAFILNSTSTLKQLATYYNFSDPSKSDYFYRLYPEQKKFVLSTRLHTLEKVVAFVPIEGVVSENFSEYEQKKVNYRDRKKATAFLLSKSPVVRNSFIECVLSFRNIQANANFFARMGEIDHKRMEIIIKNIERQQVVVPIFEKILAKHREFYSQENFPQDIRWLLNAINVFKESSFTVLSIDPSEFIIKEIKDATKIFSPYDLSAPLKSTLEKLLKNLVEFEKNGKNISVGGILDCLTVDNTAIQCGCF
ncbi:MAG: hypothetical protein A3F12_08140 [Gammaproteobacteria bacterium RIFCSPHIGHO2_12_FULL_38_14]|nr:MAG: hypothetical protein A3F12_08140 [Gammaproteobacteria bacterium RIFCSPHIGHO2_12_FULL_38_14]